MTDFRHYQIDNDRSTFEGPFWHVWQTFFITLHHDISYCRASPQPTHRSYYSSHKQKWHRLQCPPLQTRQMKTRPGCLRMPSPSYPRAMAWYLFVQRLQHHQSHVLSRWWGGNYPLFTRSPRVGKPRQLARKEQCFCNIKVDIRQYKLRIYRYKGDQINCHYGNKKQQKGFGRENRIQVP